MQNKWRKITGLLVGLTLLVNVFGWLPSAEAALIGTKDEIEMGRQYAQELERQYGVVNDAELQERINRIGQRIAAVSDRTDIKYSYKVLNSNEVNALALPGGFIYVFKGLVDYMPSDDELAGILGHETGHVTKRHTVRQIEKAMGLQLAFLIAFGDRGAMLQSLVYNAIMAGYSRTDEREADQLGFNYSLRAGFNPYSMLMGLKKLDDLEKKGTYGLFSSHPEPEARVSLVQGYMSQAKVRPNVVLASNKTAQITDTGLSLPPLSATFRGYKPYYRACFAAGALYRVSQLADFSGDRFVLDSDGTYITIYYEDREILTLTPQDASTNGVSLSDLAGQYVSAFKAWADSLRR
jgi:Zn-dependent protease with chaperone function